MNRKLFYSGVVLAMVTFAGCDGSDDTTETTAHTEKAHFSYAGDTGPDHWYELDSAWETCKNGLDITPVVEGKPHQSPIDFSSAVPVDASFTLNYNKDLEFKVVNNGHAIEFEAEGNSTVASLMIGTKVYNLKQFHFHSLSEHTENGEHAKMEGHFVNVASDGSLAVIGVLIDESNNTLNSELEKAFSITIPDENTTTSPVVELNPSLILPTGTVYSYSGSLTTPPCTEGVSWNVYTTHINLSQEKVGAFNKKYTTNYRPVTGTY
jgi:carbonic anhydrase